MQRWNFCFFTATLLVVVVLSEGFSVYDFRKLKSNYLNYYYQQRQNKKMPLYYRRYGSPYQCDGKCSPNARCTYEGFNGWMCKCLMGYSGDGYNCVEMDPCKNKDCGENSYCKKNGEEGMCLCIQGYLNADGKCDKPDLCRNNRCHKNAMCLRSGRRHRCKCSSGYIGNGYVCRRSSRLTQTRYDMFKGLKGLFF